MRNRLTPPFSVQYRVAVMYYLGREVSRDSTVTAMW